MSTRGPIPNRDADLARPRNRKGTDTQAATPGTLRPVIVPEPNLEWHPVARMAWDSLETSGMADFYQNSDWAMAYVILEELHAYLTPGIDIRATREATKEAGEPVTVRYPERKLSGMTFTALMSALQALGMTEGDRRRMRIELHREEEKPDAQLIAIDGYRGMLDEDDE